MLREIVMQEHGTLVSKVDLGPLAATVGAVSAVAVFVAATTAYSFARGVSASLGFPAQVMTLKTSTEIFPGLVSQNTVVFLLALAAGFVVFRRRHVEDKKRVKITFIWAALFVGLLFIGELWDEHWRLYWSILGLSNVCAPLLVGYSYRSFKTERGTHWIAAVFMTFLAFAINEEALYVQGYFKAKEISANIKPLYPFSEHGLSNFKVADFPLINLKTKDPLEISLQTTASPDGYFYVSNAKSFVRLIAYDDANYYVVENNSGAVRAVSIRKEAVREIIFLKSL
jgi:hypothetical protein